MHGWDVNLEVWAYLHSVINQTQMSAETQTQATCYSNSHFHWFSSFQSCLFSNYLMYMTFIENKRSTFINCVKSNIIIRLSFASLIKHLKYKLFCIHSVCQWVVRPNYITTVTWVLVPYSDPTCPNIRNDKLIFL